MEMDFDLGNALIAKLEKRVPSLPEGHVWNKYGKARLYYNTVDRRKDEDYSFYVDLSKLPVELVDFRKKFWLPQLEIDSEEELTLLIEELYFNMVHPLDEKLPINTTYEMKINRRFESVKLEEDEETIKVSPMPLEIDVKIPKEYFDEVKPTGRFINEDEIYRFVMKYEFIEKIIEAIRSVEDDADAAFMKELTRRTYGGE